jgi:hypothetical protein
MIDADEEITHELAYNIKRQTIFNNYKLKYIWSNNY